MLLLDLEAITSSDCGGTRPYNAYIDGRGGWRGGGNDGGDGDEGGEGGERIMRIGESFGEERVNNF